MNLPTTKQRRHAYVAILFLLLLVALGALTSSGKGEAPERASPISQVKPLTSPTLYDESVVSPITLTVDPDVGGFTPEQSNDVGGGSPETAAVVPTLAPLPDSVPVVVPVPVNEMRGGGGGIVSGEEYANFLAGCGVGGYENGLTEEQLKCMFDAPTAFDTETGTFYDEAGREHSIHDAPPLHLQSRDPANDTVNTYNFAQERLNCPVGKRLFNDNGILTCRNP